jgi:hypothetical protein
MITSKFLINESFMFISEFDKIRLIIIYALAGEGSPEESELLKMFAEFCGGEESAIALSQILEGLKNIGVDVANGFETYSVFTPNFSSYISLFAFRKTNIQFTID